MGGSQFYLRSTRVHQKASMEKFAVGLLLVLVLVFVNSAASRPYPSFFCRRGTSGNFLVDCNRYKRWNQKMMCKKRQKKCGSSYQVMTKSPTNEIPLKTKDKVDKKTVKWPRRGKDFRLRNNPIGFKRRPVRA